MNLDLLTNATVIDHTTIREIAKQRRMLDVIIDEDFHLFTFQRFGILVKLFWNPDN
jgi:hypothetical protein